jgi:hypothetical protein
MREIFEIVPSPAKTKRIPVIIGFLECLYGPRITNFLGGSQGANVPSKVNRFEEYDEKYEHSYLTISKDMKQSDGTK